MTNADASPQIDAIEGGTGASSIDIATAKLPGSALVSGQTSQATLDFRKARDFLLSVREDYDKAVREFVWPDPPHFNYALDWFDVVASDPHTADRLALWLVEMDGSETKRTYADLRKRSNQAAHWLREQGVERGDRVLFVLGNQVELWVLSLAMMKIGAVLMPTTTLADAVELRQRISAGGARVVVARGSELANYDTLGDLTGDMVCITTGEAPAGWRHFDEETVADRSTDFTAEQATSASDPLFMYYTSGTTAEAKLVEHTQVSYTIGHLSTMYWIGVRPGDVHLNISSPGWGKHAWSNFFAPFHVGATVYLFNYERFNAGRLLDEMERARITSFCAPPTVWRMLIQADLTRLKHPPTSVVGAGEPLNPEVIAQVEDAWGVTIRDGYGQTETTLQIGNFPGQPVKSGSMGKPAPGYVVTLRDEDGDEITEPGHPGEICLSLDSRPIGLTPGYANAPERTREVMRDGWYHTSDVAYRDEDGYITYVGRTDDVFKASDYRISPFELESALLEHDWVAEAAVVPSPDPLRLAVPKAYVTLVEGVEPTAETAQELFGFSRERLSPYKRIRRMTFASELPKTISGKIRRVELRVLEAELYADPSARPEGEFRG
ncbi:AMP-binding protein [Rarobacter incanus]|uniref:Acetyl-CoA synthetase n=1 Tax=Rarobacter incanus TaxID=153494 RepID=A0A542SPC0_9MICO|nr:AMP-binding protein [Rarobacter incanus]TQK76464.1 acetyl-CoA synthetase [Rarobacter incanus]